MDKVARQLGTILPTLLLEIHRDSRVKEIFLAEGMKKLLPAFWSKNHCRDISSNDEFTERL